jgi:hypothetical protein
LALGLVVLRLGLVAADDVAAAPRLAIGADAGSHHLLDQKIGAAAAGHLGDRERHIGCRIGDHAADFLGRALAHAEDVVDVAGLEFGKGGGADHAAVGDDADASDQEAGLEPLDHRQQGGNVGGIAGPQLGTNGPPAAVDDDREHDLLQIRAVVLRVSVSPEALTAGALEIERSGVEKHQAELAEQIVAQGEQPFLDQVFGGARGEAAPALIGQFVAQPAHGAVEMVQIEIADPIDDQPLPPLLGGAVGAGIEQPVQHGEKHRAFEIELERAFAGQFVDHPLAAGVLPQPFEGERRAELAGRHFGGFAPLVGGQHHGTVGKARPRTQQSIEGAILRQFVDPTEGGDDRLARLAIDALVLDDLQILGAPGTLAAEEHGGLVFNHHDLTLSPPVCNQKSPILWHYVNAKFQTRLNKIKGLRVASGPSL